MYISSRVGDKCSVAVSRLSAETVVRMSGIGMTIWFRCVTALFGLSILVGGRVLCDLSLAIDAPVVIEILEEQPGGTVLVHDLQARLPSSLVAGASASQLQLAIGNPTSPGIDKLTVQPHQTPSSGTPVAWQLIVKPGQRGPDREELCGQTDLSARSNAVVSIIEPQSSTACDLSLLLLLLPNDRGRPGYARVLLRLLDVNDNAPKFSRNGRITLRVPESLEPAGLGTPFSLGAADSDSNVDGHRPVRLALPAAYDADLPENGVQAYRLKTEAEVELELFRLEGTESPVLVVQGRLDRERTAAYTLHVLAVDAGSPQRTGTLTVRLEVADRNDNAPIFTAVHFHFPAGPATLLGGAGSDSSPRLLAARAPPRWETELVRLPETVPVDTRLASLVAEDPDDADNGQIVYRLAEPPRSDGEALALRWLRLQTVNATGLLSVRGPLDADQGSPSAWLFSRTDQPVTGRLVEFTVEAVDRGAPELTGRTRLRLLVENVNDNPPQITVQYTQPAPGSSPGAAALLGSLRENRPAGQPTPVAHLTVTDGDRLPETQAAWLSRPGLSSELELGPSVHCRGNDSRFRINALPGELGVASGDSVHLFRVVALAPVDRERSQVIRLQVTCVDAPNDLVPRSGLELTGTALLSLLVLDVNDEAPVFSRSHYRFLVPEVDGQAQLGYPGPPGPEEPGRAGLEPILVGRVQATDADAGRNGELTYRLVGNGAHLPDGQDLFHLDEKTGELWRVGLLDRETTPRLLLRVEAVDGGGGGGGGGSEGEGESEGESSDYAHPLSGFADIEIVVVDVNDNPPRFVLGARRRRFDAAKQMGDGDGDGDGYGDMDETLEPLANGADEVFHFSVAEDAASGHLIGVVEVEDADEPAVSSLPGPEAEPVGSGHDNSSAGGQKRSGGSLRRGSGFGSLVYQLERGNASRVFSMDQRTGELRVRQSLDREQHSFYEFQVVVVDNPYPRRPASVLQSPGSLDWRRQHTVTATIRVTVLDVNDNAPVFEAPLAGQEFLLEPGSLAASAGATVFVVKTADRDEGENGTVQYSLEMGGHGLVELEPTTGVCYLQETLSWTRLHQLTPQLTVVNTPMTTVEETEAAADHGRLSGGEETARTRRSWFSLTLLIRAYDLGRPVSLNASRIVRLVWTADRDASGPDGRVVDEEEEVDEQEVAASSAHQAKTSGPRRLETAVPGSRLAELFPAISLTEKTLVPVLVSMFLLLSVACCLLLGLLRCRNKTSTTRSTGSRPTEATARPLPTATTTTTATSRTTLTASRICWPRRLLQPRRTTAELGWVAKSAEQKNHLPTGFSANYYNGAQTGVVCLTDELVRSPGLFTNTRTPLAGKPTDPDVDYAELPAGRRAYVSAFAGRVDSHIGEPNVPFHADPNWAVHKE